MLKYSLFVLLFLISCAESPNISNYYDEDPEQNLRVTCYDKHNNIISVTETHKVYFYGSKKKTRCFVEIVE